MNERRKHVDSAMGCGMNIRSKAFTIIITTSMYF